MGVLLANCHLTPRPATPDHSWPAASPCQWEQPPGPHAGLGTGLRRTCVPGEARRTEAGVAKGEPYGDFLFKVVLSWPALTLFYFP